MASRRSSSRSEFHRRTHPACAVQPIHKHPDPAVPKILNQVFFFHSLFLSTFRHILHLSSATQILLSFCFVHEWIIFHYSWKETNDGCARLDRFTPGTPWMQSKWESEASKVSMTLFGLLASMMATIDLPWFELPTQIREEPSHSVSSLSRASSARARWNESTRIYFFDSYLIFFAKVSILKLFTLWYKNLSPFSGCLANSQISDQHNLRTSWEPPFKNR